MYEPQYTLEFDDDHPANYRFGVEDEEADFIDDCEDENTCNCLYCPCERRVQSLGDVCMYCSSGEHMG